MPPAAAAAARTTDAERAQQLLKTGRKSVKDAERRLKEATTALSEGKAAGALPEQIRKLEYGVQTQQSRLDDARNTLRYAERSVQQHAAPPPTAVTPEPVTGVVTPPVEATPLPVPPEIDTKLQGWRDEVDVWKARLRQRPIVGNATRPSPERGS